MSTYKAQNEAQAMACTASLTERGVEAMRCGATVYYPDHCPDEVVEACATPQGLSDAAQAYVTRQANIAGLLDGIRERLAAHANAGPIQWARVGDLARVEELLQETQDLLARA